MLDLDAMIAEARQKKRDRDNAAKILVERLTGIEAEVKSTLAPMLDLMPVTVEIGETAVFAKMQKGKTVCAFRIIPRAAAYKMECNSDGDLTTATVCGDMSPAQAVEQLMWSLRGPIFRMIERAI